MGVPITGVDMDLQFPANEQERLKALHQLNILDTPAEAAFDNLTALTADIMGVPIALVSLIDHDRQWFKSCIGLGAPETARDISFCTHAVFEESVFVVEDAKADERFADNPLVTGEPFIRFYAGAPLYSEQGFILGTLCIIDTQPRSRESVRIDQLKLLARQADQLIKMHQQAQLLKKQIAETQAVNARYQASTQGASTGIVRITGRGHILEVNRFICQLLGYTENEMLGNNVSMLMPAQWGVTHDGYLAAYQRTGVAKVIGIGREVPALHRDGHTIPVHLAVSEVASNAKPEDYDQRQFVGILTNLSELYAARDRAEKASQAKTDFLSSISHELRTPMNAILGFAQLLQNSREPLPPRQHRQVEQITRSGHHLLNLINEVLDLTRIEAGRIQLSIDPVYLPDVIREAVEIISPLADQKGLSVTLPATNSSELGVRGDYTRIKQVLINLLNNAIKYNRDAGSVTLSCMARDNTCRISIRDTGIGIPEDRLGELFKPFNRLGAEHGSIEGTGVGLALTHKLVGLMQGQVGVESQLGEGSTFWFELPLYETETPARPSNQLSKQGRKQ